MAHSRVALRWPLFAVAVLAVTLATGSRQTPLAHADAMNMAIVACENLAPYLDGDAADVTTPADLDAACTQPLPSNGPLSIAALETTVGTPDGQFLFEDVIPLDALDNNRLPSDCTYAAVVTNGTKPAPGCTLLVFAFVDDEKAVTLDVPVALSSAETGGDAACATEGIALGQDNDCVDDGWPLPDDGDGVVVFHVLNATAGDGQSMTVSVSQEAIEYSAQVSISALSRNDPDSFDDGDGVPTPQDNCPFSHNPDQLNTDSNPTITPGVLPADTSIPVSDGLGDACDSDDDNDGLTDYNELHVDQVPPIRLVFCPAASDGTDPSIADSDGDLVLDFAECLMGSDPLSPSSLPAPPASDADGDGLADESETAIGSSPNAVDTDGDGILDGIEFKGYNTSLILTDTDGDGCSDGAEIASVDASSSVNSIDLQIVAKNFLLPGKPAIDVNKDGNINSLDLQLVAHQFAPFPCDVPD